MVPVHSASIQGCKSVSSIGGGDDRNILVILLILGGMILKFLISGSCYAQTHAFSTHFLQIFLMTFFCFKTYQYLSYLASSVPQNTFSFPAWYKNIREFPAMSKNLNYWGVEVKYWEMYPPSPGDLQPCIHL